MLYTHAPHVIGMSSDTIEGIRFFNSVDFSGETATLLYRAPSSLLNLSITITTILLLEFWILRSYEQICVVRELFCFLLDPQRR